MNPSFTNRLPNSAEGLLSRRGFLAATMTAALAGPAAGAADPKKRLRVAAIYSVFSYRGHAHVVLQNFLKPYYFCGQLIKPDMDVVSFHPDQIDPRRDLTQEVAREFKVEVFPTVEGALCLGGKELAVDAVLSIFEQGEYPFNELGQQLYPRKKYFDEIVKVMRKSGRFVPIFNDKHLSYRWDWAKEMYDTAKQLHIPFMAGSSVPLAPRMPSLELPKDAEIEEALCIHAGPPDAYGFHALEVVQSLVEARKGGETGIAQVGFVPGKDLVKAGEQGRFSLDLVRAALAVDRPPNKPVMETNHDWSHGILLNYKDGLRAAALSFGKTPEYRWVFACRLKGEHKPRACRFDFLWNDRTFFSAQAHAVQHMFRTGEPAYPVERTLLTTGATEAGMRAKAAGKPLATPHLEFGYVAKDFRAFRENGESLKVVGEELPGINPIGRKK
jgi:hypothetical protein